MTAKITLPCGTVALLDIEDLPLLAGYRWYRFKLKGKNITYVRGRRPGQTSGGVFLHRLVFGDTGIDHANGDGLDNRRSNLRRATPQANAFNQGKHRGQVQYKGVTLDQRGRYRARLTMEGRTLLNSSHDTPEAAAQAYDAAARQHFGVFARLNFPKLMQAAE